jgi:hypothetical protein
MNFNPVIPPFQSIGVTRQQSVDVEGELGHGGSSKLLLVPCITILIPQAGLDNDPDLWNMFLDEVKEEDIRFTDSWKEDASSILTFVSHNPGPCVRLGDKLQDRSFLRNCWRIHH